MIRYPVVSKFRNPWLVSSMLLAGSVGPLVQHSPAAAQTGSERTLAEALFRQGRKLMSSGRYAEACPKFAESHRLDPGGGTLLNLAVCHQSQGKLATAWAEFQEALAQAQSDGRQDRVSLAKERIEQLEPNLARLTVIVPDFPPEGLVVAVNGTPLGAAAWESAIPVDTGLVKVTASANGREAFTKSLQIRDGQHRSIHIPELPLSANPEDGGASTSVAAEDSAPTHTSAYVIGAVGLGALGVGSYFGVRALQEHEVAEQHCDVRCRTSAGSRAERSAVFNGWLSTVGIGAGLTLIGVAAYLYASEDNASTPERTLAASKLGINPRVNRHGAAMEVLWRH